MPVIVADDAIAWVHEAFGDLGELRSMPGPAIDRSSLLDADVLLVRSVTRVDERLLAGTRVRFVGSATAGIDHVDLPALHARGIAFANAPGCNADAVVQYVVTAIVETLAERGLGWLGDASIGVVGFGQIGRRLVPKLRGLGFDVLVADPPLQESIAGAPAPTSAFERLASDEAYVPLHELLERCRIVTLHVPWTPDGPHATAGLLDAAALARLPPASLLVNASRGGIVDEPALRAFVGRGRGTAILDTWAHEPRIDPATVAAARIATPHIAGYSFEGKLRATTMVLRSLGEHLGCTPAFDGAALSGEPERLSIGTASSSLDALATLLRHTCPLHRDDAALREVAVLDPPGRGAAFERLRKHYPFRREPSHFAIARSEVPPRDGTLPVELGVAAATLGFRVD